MRSDVKITRYNSIVYTVERGVTHIGAMLQMANGTWRAFDTNERPLSTQSFDTPKDGLVLFKEIPPND